MHLESILRFNKAFPVLLTYSMHSKYSFNDVLAIASGDCNHTREQMRNAIGPAGLATALSKGDMAPMFTTL